MQLLKNVGGGREGEGGKEQAEWTTIGEGCPRVYGWYTPLDTKMTTVRSKLTMNLTFLVINIYLEYSIN
jgi:hypothetical protein